MFSAAYACQKATHHSHMHIIYSRTNTCLLHSLQVMLYGHSLGGCVAAYLRAEYPGGPLVHDRSFLSLDKVVLGWARKYVHKSWPCSVFAGRGLDCHCANNF